MLGVAVRGRGNDNPNAGRSDGGNTMNGPVVTIPEVMEIMGWTFHDAAQLTSAINRAVERSSRDAVALSLRTLAAEVEAK